ncbi:glycoside hydrolase 43 family protein [Pseudoflavitalea rhizosphaerae]|uniref:glycoside hydrolase family 43 protein n=1 Tax=Pseudoflavitalea rhizosphaerae TaxID=1884793 RepID=UPI000F8E8726|nr:glycoside hydrolase 43 family protein [Pseudoflavitalea rhizosphaerae]
MKHTILQQALALMMLACPFALPAQQKPASSVSQVWVADNGDGTYKNPVLHADYSDPDAVRVGEDFYMTASSFNAAPGLPVLHSRDLVNWKLIAYALPKQIPPEVFSKPQHGNGVWAPSIRFHNGEFYIYYPDPDFGVYLIKAKHPAGPWTEPVLVEGGRGLIDPCPLWDDNGDVYLVHAYAGSRAGIKSIIVVKKLNAAGTKVLDAGRLVYDGHDTDPTIEGPKFYKRNGYYYIFAPAGGVSTGWQLVLRSKNIYGPYERKVVMDQGSSPINGPHQGAWVNTPTGQDWFLHFQDKDAYGRIVHLQPMRWVNNWPVIGMDKDGDGKGEPVLIHKKPSGKSPYGTITPPDSDEFNDTSLGLQWQWQANPAATWSFSDAIKGGLRLYSVQQPDDAKNLWDLPNLLLQKFPAEEFTATTKLSFHPSPKKLQEKTGLVVLGLDYAALELQAREDGQYLVYTVCENAEKKTGPKNRELTKIGSKDLYLRVMVTKGGICRFSYSTDGNQFTLIESIFTAKPGKWVGAKLGLFCSRTFTTNDAGHALIDWFRIHKNIDLK